MEQPLLAVGEYCLGARVGKRVGAELEEAQARLVRPVGELSRGGVGRIIMHEVGVILVVTILIFEMLYQVLVK